MGTKFEEGLKTDTVNSNLIKASNAAIEAGKAIMDVYSTDFDVDIKSDNSPLTLADRKANDIINAILIQTNIPIISEENKETPFEIRKNWDQVWIVDPLDGTKEFVKRNGEFTVNIALIQDGKPMQGIIFVPVTKSLYLSDVSKKQALKMELSEYREISETDLISATDLNKRAIASNKLRIVGSRSHMNEETISYTDQLKTEGNNIEIVSRGSSLKFCIVAEGGADVYPRFAPTMEWDTAAGQAICEACGVSVMVKDIHQPLRYNKENLLNPHFIVERTL